MPTRNKAQLEENLRRAEARVRAAKNKVKSRRQSRRSAIAQQPAETRAIMYSMIPQTRRHLAKMARKQKQVLTQTMAQFAGTKDPKQKVLLRKRAERQASMLNGVIASMRRKRERAERGFVFPEINVLSGQSHREELPIPTMDAPLSADTVAALARLVAGQVPRDAREDNDINFRKLFGLTQRAVARYVNASKQINHEQAMAHAVKETVDRDYATILDEALAGGLRPDPASASVSKLIAAQAEDIIAASEDLQQEQKQIAFSAKDFAALLKNAASEEAKAMEEEESLQDEIIQDILLAAVPVTDEVVEKVKQKKKKRAKRNPDADPESTPLYKQPLAWLVVGLLIFWNTKDSK